MRKKSILREPDDIIDKLQIHSIFYQHFDTYIEEEHYNKTSINIEKS